VKSLGEITNCLDNVRVPLNEAQREKMRGDHPYCGANGILDFVNGYVIDDDVILIAEDGGYFDEYKTRPIAYRMVGKCWVNNHAHILKAKANFDQGFIFYSLVHKNILPFLASGTRTKLNKSQMNKIELKLPKEEAEQTAIAAILLDIDTELVGLEQRLAKIRDLKQAIMQELLTGKTRLVAKEATHA
jgi:type I restriction enzyme S subunit